MIAFFGTGLLGSNFVRALLRSGEAVHVWNRTPERARALEAEGAAAFADPAAAVRGASRVHLTLSDDGAVDEVLERLRPGLEAGTPVVDHTTTSPAGTAARGRRCADAGIAFQHAPVFMGPQNALEATGVMLASGERARFDALAPVLEKMTGRLVYLGPEVERAASFKLLGNLLLMFLTSGCAELLTLARASGIPAAEAATLFDWFNPAGGVAARMKRIISADFAHPSWTLAMARKDARLMLEAAEQGGAPLSLLPHIAATMDGWIDRGHGKDDWTIIAQDALMGAAPRDRR